MFSFAESFSAELNLNLYLVFWVNELPRKRLNKLRMRGIIFATAPFPSQVSAPKDALKQEDFFLKVKNEHHAETAGLALLTHLIRQTSFPTLKTVVSEVAGLNRMREGDVLKLLERVLVIRIIPVVGILLAPPLIKTFGALYSP